MSERGQGASKLQQASQRMPASLSSNDGGHGTQSRLASHGDLVSGGAADKEINLGIQSLASPRCGLELHDPDAEKPSMKDAAGPTASATHATATSYKRVLSAADLMSIGFGNIIGAGIFAYSGITAKVAGSAMAFSWLLAGLVALLTTLVYAELSSKIKKSGSSYIYAYIMTGEFTAYMIGWNLFARFGLSTCIQGRAFSSYLSGWLELNGVKVPSFIFTYELFGYQTSLMAVAFISTLAYLSSRASQSSKNANHLFTILKMSLVVVIIFMAFANVGSDNYNNVLNPNKGVEGVLQGDMICYFGYVGFDIQNQFTKEVINP